MIECHDRMKKCQHLSSKVFILGLLTHYVKHVRLTKWRQIFDRHLLAGWVEGDGGHLQGLVGFL